MFPAAFSGAPVVSDKPPAPVPIGVIAPRVSTQLVRIAMMPAAREGDKVLSPVGGGNLVILKGEPSVRIEGMPAARMTDPIGPKQAPSPPPDPTGLGPKPSVPSAPAAASIGRVGLGCPTVLIGSIAQASPLVRAAEHGTPFCEECEKAPPSEGT